MRSTEPSPPVAPSCGAGRPALLVLHVVLACCAAVSVVSAPRRAHLWFYKLLSSNWTIRTENPWEANLFFVPVFANANGVNVGWREGSAGGRPGSAAQLHLTSQQGSGYG